MSSRGRSGLACGERRWGDLARALAVGCSLVSFGGVAQAQVFQTDAARTPLPQPVGMAELSLGQSWAYDVNTMCYYDTSGVFLDTPLIYGQYYSPPAFPQFVNGDEFKLQGLFKWRGEQIDPVADASTSRGHFFPGCGFKAELVLHGGNCDAVLGWYNFTGTSAPPADTDIQPLVPKGSTYLHAAHELAPLGWDNRNPRNLSLLDWTPQAFSTGDITDNPKYAGGDVAFVLLGVPSSSCKASKYSVYEHNAKNSNGVPWVTALSYRSTADPTAIYLAFEDLPMLAADWRQAGAGYTNDGDFNDAVFFISGLGATKACPDPACANVVCDLDMTCSAGTCVPGTPSAGTGQGGEGGGGDGGASSGGSAMGGADNGPTPVNDSGGVAGQSPLDGTAGDENPDNAAGAADTPSDGGAGASGTTTAGASSHGGADSGASSGCSCHVGAAPHEAASLWLFIALATVRARRRLRPWPCSRHGR